MYSKHLHLNIHWTNDQTCGMLSNFRDAKSSLWKRIASLTEQEKKNNIQRLLFFCVDFGSVNNYSFEYAHSNLNKKKSFDDLLCIHRSKSLFFLFVQSIYLYIYIYMYVNLFFLSNPSKWCDSFLFPQLKQQQKNIKKKIDNSSFEYRQCRTIFFLSTINLSYIFILMNHSRW